MPAKPVNERDLVLLCMSDLCKSAGFADTSQLVQRDLEFLCDSIDSKTGVLISLSTMRRLLNGQFARLPQVATLNAMATYIGYQNWQDFKCKKIAAETPTAAAINNPLPESTTVVTVESAPAKTTYP